MEKIVELINAKKPFCKHNHGCIQSAFAQAFKNIKYGVIISAILQIVRSLRALLKGKQAFKNSFNKRILSIIVFMVASTLALRLVKCGLKWFRQTDDGFNSLVAGMTAGYVDYWYLLLMFLSSRLIGAVHDYLIQNKILNPKHRWLHHYLMFNFSHSIHSFGFFLQPDILKPDMYNLYEKMAALTPNEQKWHLGALQHHQKMQRLANSQQFDDLLSRRIQKIRDKVYSGDNL